jgi:eukaryotic-like serine/threonine-protein kinase
VSEPPGIAEVVAIQVADGVPVDWDTAFRSAPDQRQRDLLSSLRMLANVAQAHGGLPTTTLEVFPSRHSSPMPATWAYLEVRERLGAGGFAEVYRAWDPRLDREVALKLLRAGSTPGDAATSRVIEEGRLLARLRHPNVVMVFGAEVHEGRIGLWMEFVRGRSLEQVLRDHGPLGAREAASIGVDLCRALSAVHRAGVIHRDVKAQNVMREEGGRIVLMDFGAGIEVAGDEERREPSVSGTPLYMAPELFSGEPAGKRSDIYSLGVLLYHLVTGSFPIEATSWNDLRSKHSRREATLLRDRRSDLPDAFVTVVERAMARESQERFATAGAMEQALSFALGAESVPTGAQDPMLAAEQGRRAWGGSRFALAAAGVLAVGVVVAGLLISTRIARRPVPEGSDAARPADSGVAGAATSYTVDVALYRTPANSEERERIEPGARLALDDRLNLEFRASTPLHVYVIDEDDAGHAYSLFPLPGVEPGNPLPAGQSLLLPGSRGGRPMSWTVNSPGGREHLMVLASPTRLVEFEAAMNGLARPGEDAVLIPETAMGHLRGIGGLADSPASGVARSAGPLFEMAQTLASRSEVANGVWLRRVELESPRPR